VRITVGGHGGRVEDGTEGRPGSPNAMAAEPNGRLLGIGNGSFQTLQPIQPSLSGGARECQRGTLCWTGTPGGMPTPPLNTCLAQGRAWQGARRILSRRGGCSGRQTTSASVFALGAWR